MRIVTITEDELKSLIRDAVSDAISRHIKQPDAKLPDLLTRQEAAELLKYSPATVSRYYNHNGLTPITRGRQLFYRTDEVLALKKRLFR